MTFLVYFLIPLLAYVFIPKADTSRDVSGNTGSDKGNLGISTENIETPKPGLSDVVQTKQEGVKRHPRSRLRHTRYRSEKRRHTANDNENLEYRNNEDLASIATEVPTEHYSVPDASTHSHDTDTQTAIQDDHPDDDVEIDHIDDSVTDPQVSNKERQDNATYDGIANYSSESNGTEITTQYGYVTAPSPTACPKCGSREKQERLHVEMFKQTILSKLGMKTAPKVEGPLPPLPFDFYLGEDFTVSDEPEDEDDERSSVKTREMFIFGTDGMS